MARGGGLLVSMLLSAAMAAGCTQLGRPSETLAALPTPLATAAPSPFEPTPAEATMIQGSGSIPAELVGTWTQDSAGSSTFYFSRSAYKFDADGTYALLDLLCSQDSNGTTCQQANPPESGVATVSGDHLTLNPRTQSAAGPRTYRFAVVRDPDLGDLRLDFFMPDYVDEWFWLPDG